MMKAKQTQIAAKLADLEAKRAGREAQQTAIEANIAENYTKSKTSCNSSKIKKQNELQNKTSSQNKSETSCIGCKLVLMETKQTKIEHNSWNGSKSSCNGNKINWKGREMSCNGNKINWKGNELPWKQNQLEWKGNELQIAMEETIAGMEAKLLESKHNKAAIQQT